MPSSQISTAVTYSSRCAHSLSNVLLQSLQKRQHLSLSNPILLFSLAPSSATPPEVLSGITSTLTQLYPEHIGCISAPLPHQYLGLRIPSGPHSCSLAYAFVNGVSFRSTISGRADIQVGRWHAARRREDGNGAGVNIEDSETRIIDDLAESCGQFNWEGVWDRAANSVTCLSSSRHGNGIVSEMLPDALQSLDPSTIDSIFYFSDKAPEGLATVLESAFPTANKLSLIASSTPFITGRPVTLFHNGSILSSGAVGVAFKSPPSSPSPMVELSFPQLVPLSTDLSVTSSEGNLIISLDFGNPTKLLLSGIEKYGLSSHTWVGKEDEFYIGVVDPSSRQVSQLHRINAGDPSRGAIALDNASAPRKGSVVRLYHLPSKPVPDAPTYIPDANSNKISLFVAPEIMPTANFRGEFADGQTEDGDHLVVPNAFLAASENGFTLSRGVQGPWKCVVPGARTGLSWTKLK